MADPRLREGVAVAVDDLAARTGDSEDIGSGMFLGFPSGIWGGDWRVGGGDRGRRFRG